MVAQLPSAQARCGALARIWAAAVASDLDTRRAVRARQKTLPGAELKLLLSDAFAMEVISGAAEGAFFMLWSLKLCVGVHGRQKAKLGMTQFLRTLMVLQELLWGQHEVSPAFMLSWPP